MKDIMLCMLYILILYNPYPDPRARMEIIGSFAKKRKIIGYRLHALSTAEYGTGRYIRPPLCMPINY